MRQQILSAIANQPARCSIALAVLLCAATAGAATITGQVRLEGKAPPAKKIKMVEDPRCAAIHATKPATDDSLTVNADNTIPDVFVYVKNPPKGSYPAPATPVELDQKGCIFTPKMVGVMVGQPFEIVNSDPTLHNVHSFPKVNKEFNLGMPMQGQRIRKVFKSAEPLIPIKCDIHPWMLAYVNVMNHPFFCATAAKGTYTIGNLPPGKYTIEAWHQKLGSQVAEVELREGETRTVELTFKATLATPGRGR